MSVKEEKTVTTKTTARDDLLAEAEAATTRAAEINAAIAAEEFKKHEARLEAQRRWDEQLVAGFSRAKVDAEVAAVKATLDEELAANPLVVALANWQIALRRRSHQIFENTAARSRIGLPTGAVELLTTDLSTVDEYVIRAANRLADDTIAAEQSAFQARRDAAGTDPEETN